MSYAIQQAAAPPPEFHYLDPAGIQVELIEVENITLMLPASVDLPCVNEEFFIDEGAYDSDELDLLEVELAYQASNWEH